MESTPLKLLIVAVGGYVAYRVLQNMGILGGSTFSDAASLLAYCRANPNGSATYQAPGSTPVTATCAQWLEANPSAATAGTLPAVGPAGTPPVTAPVSNVVALMQQAAGPNVKTLNFDQWSFYYQHVTGKNISPAQMGQIVTAGGGSSTAQITAAQFYGYLQAAGLSGWRPAGTASPYASWVN